jgi:hypothetical protein
VSGNGQAFFGGYLNAAVRLRQSLNDFLYSKGGANRSFKRELSRLRREKISCFVFGGFARSVYLHGAEAAPKDVDLVFDRVNFDRFIESFSASIIKKNRFGGANLQIGGVDVDAWCIEDTWAFKQGYFTSASFSSLPCTTYLSADGIAVELWPKGGHPRKVYSKGFFETFEYNILGLNFDPNPFPELTALRTLVASKRNCLGLSPALARSTATILKEVAVDCIYRTQLKHYKAEILSFDEMLSFCHRLMAHVNNTPDNSFIFYREIHQHLLALQEAGVESRVSRMHGDSGVQLNLL